MLGAHLPFFSLGDAKPSHIVAVSGKVTDKHSAICEQLLALIVDQNYDKAALVAKRDELIAGSNPYS